MIDDSLANRTGVTNPHTFKTEKVHTKICQGCDGDPLSYEVLVGEKCHACGGTGKRRS